MDICSIFSMYMSVKADQYHGTDVDGGYQWKRIDIFPVLIRFQQIF
jgi:hypothetical protein